MWDKALKIAGAVLTLGALIGVAFGAQAYFAKSCDLDELKEEIRIAGVRINKNYLYDELRQIQAMIRDVEYRHGTDMNRMPPDIRSHYRWLLDKQRELEEKLRQGQ